jgi:hypothetical protein
MSDSVQLTPVDGGGRSIWLYRLEDGSLRLSEVDRHATSPDPRSIGSGLTIPPASLDRVAFALLVERYRGRSEVFHDMQQLLSAEFIEHVMEQGP